MHVPKVKMAPRALHRELEESIEEADAGQTMDFAEFLAELRRRT